MGPTSFPRWLLAPLLFLLLGSGTAAVPSAESSYHQAKAVYDRGEVNEARAIAAPALARFRDSDDAWVWRLRILYADLLIATGKAPDARALLERPVPPALRGSDIEVLRVRGLGVAAKISRDDSGDALLQQAYALALHRPRTLPSVLLALATFNDAKRELLAREALTLTRKSGDVPTQLRALGTIAVDLANHERFDEAIGIWEAGLAKARAIGNAQLQQKFEGNLGWGFLELGDYETAAERLGEAYKTAMRIGARRDAVPWLYQLGNVRLQAGDLAGADKQYHAAYDLAVEANPGQKAIVLAYLANAALKAGRVADARRHAEQSLAERRQAKDVAGEMRSLLLLGRVATAAGQLDDAQRILKDVIAHAQSSSTLWEAHGRLAELYVKATKFPAADGEFRQMLGMARKARDSVNDKELRFAFFTAIAELFDSYVEFLIARDRAVEALTLTDAIRAQTLEEGLADVADPRDVRVIARETRATILCYWLGSAHSYLWVVTPANVRLVTLPPRATIENSIDAYQRALLGANGSLALSGAKGVALWRMLVAPAGLIDRDSRVIIVPDGRLHAFNMETLVVPAPAQHYWIEDAVLSSASSLRLLVQHAAPKPTAAPRLLLVGDAPPPPGSNFPALPQAGVEIRNVARHFDRPSAVVLSGAKATPSAYRAASPESFAFLHFVAHGVATREKPLDSAIVLAREGDTFKLYARDIAKQRLSAHLVTISSCHGAGTRAYVGEGLVGLGWAFLHAGADNVIAALWNVKDTATPDLMDRMYASIRAGRDPAVALRDAKLALVRGQGAYRRPLYWAPFVLYAGS